MKLSCLPVSLYEDIFSGKRSILDWVHFGADLGLDGIDVSVKFFPTRETQMLEAIFEEDATPEEWKHFIKINYDYFGREYSG